MTDEPLGGFHQAMLLATTGRFRDVHEVDLEMRRLGSPRGLADVPKNQRTYVNELCVKNSEGVIRRD